jgi:hypothetical protein
MVQIPIRGRRVLQFGESGQNVVVITRRCTARKPLINIGLKREDDAGLR